MRIKLLVSLAFPLAVLLSCSGKTPALDNPGPDPPTPPEKTDIVVESGKNLVGIIEYSDGTPAGGVVVTDGYSCTATDEKGIYQLTRHRESRNVIVSWPADCKIKVKENQIPDFFRPIDSNAKGVVREDFTLERLAGGAPESFIFYPIGDPQIKTKAQIDRFAEEILADLNDNIARQNVPVFAITLGDVCDWNPAMFGEIACVFENLDAPCFHVIGNHDRDPRNVAPDNYYVSTLKTFEKFYTPVNYSFNYGDAHFVILDDIRDKQSGYDVDLSDDQIEWLEEDLSYVPKDKLLIVCLHGPVRTNRPSFTKRAELLGLMDDYAEAHIFSGHTHTNFTMFHNDYGGIPEHVVGAACGMYWYGSICIDGTPHGYGRFLVEGNTVKNSIFKSAGYDEDVQARLYDSSRFTGWSNDRNIYANVWNSTPEWRVELWEDGDFSVVMTRKNQYDYSINQWISNTTFADGYNPDPVTIGEMYSALPKSASSKKSIRITDQYGQIFWIDNTTTDYNSYSAPK